MSTNSSISIQLKNKKIISVYCHWDGSLNWNGKKLFNYYRNAKKVKELIKHGFISSLEKRVHPIKSHNFDERDPETTTFYNRDRGDEICINKINSIKDIKRFYCNSMKHHYLFKNNRWYYSENGLKWIKIRKEMF